MRGAPQVGSLPACGRLGPALPWHLLPTDSFSRLGDQAPVHAKASTMLTDHCRRRDNNERLLPSGPEPASGDAKEFVQGAELGLGMPALQYRELLPARQILQEQVLAWANKAKKCSEPKPKKAEHGQQS